VNDIGTNVVGWFGAMTLLLTMMRQVYTQWREGSVGGVSSWLFAGQMLASAAFTTYSIQQEDPVFVATNSLMLINAVLGLVIDRRNRRKQAMASHS